MAKAAKDIVFSKAGVMALVRTLRELHKIPGVSFAVVEMGGKFTVDVSDLRPLKSDRERTMNFVRLVMTVFAQAVGAGALQLRQLHALEGIAKTLDDEGQDVAAEKIREWIEDANRLCDDEVSESEEGKS